MLVHPPGSDVPAPPCAWCPPTCSSVTATVAPVWHRLTTGRETPLARPGQLRCGHTYLQLATGFDIEVPPPAGVSARPSTFSRPWCRPVRAPSERHARRLRSSSRRHPVVGSGGRRPVRASWPGRPLAQHRGGPRSRHTELGSSSAARRGGGPAGRTRPRRAHLRGRGRTGPAAGGSWKRPLVQSPAFRHGGRVRKTPASN